MGTEVDTAIEVTTPDDARVSDRAAILNIMLTIIYITGKRGAPLVTDPSTPNPRNDFALFKNSDGTCYKHITVRFLQNINGANCKVTALLIID